MIKSANATGKLVAGWENCCDYLVKKGHAWHSPIHSGKVITFPGNRSGALASQKSHTLGCKIVNAGWSWKKAAAATCVQMPDDPVERQTALEVNEKMSRLSNGKIPMHDDNVQAMAIGGNHTNLFIRAVDKKAPTSIKKLASADGTIDKARIIADPGIKKACEEGPHWLIISNVAAKWPGLVQLGQRALNTFASEPQSEIELICRAGACPCCCVHFVLCARALQLMCMIYTHLERERDSIAAWSCTHAHRMFHYCLAMRVMQLFAYCFAPSSLHAHMCPCEWAG